MGAVVSALPEATKAERTQLLGNEIEQLVVEAKRLGIGFDEMIKSIARHWEQLGGNAGRLTPRSDPVRRDQGMSSAVSTENLTKRFAD